MRDMRLFRLLVVENAFGPGVDILDANNGGHFAYSIERFKGCFGFAHVAFNRFMRHVDEGAGFPVFAFCLADMGNGNAAFGECISAGCQGSELVFDGEANVIARFQVIYGTYGQIVAEGLLLGHWGASLGDRVG